MAESIAPTAVTAPYGEAERQAAELAALRRMLEVARGCFSLSVAVCNSPALRDDLIGRAREWFPDIRVISLPAGIVDVFGFVAPKGADSAPSALFLTNLEASIQSDQERHPVLRSLNASRELWPRKFPCPIVFWLPEYAAALLSTQARDFWRYRSHSFEFVSEHVRALADAVTRVSGDLTAAGNLTREEKRFRIAELEDRIADAGDPPSSALASHCSTWLTELGFLHRFIGDLDRAEQMFRKAMEIDEKLGRMEGVATQSGNLGLIYQTRGDLDRAEQMHRKALEIDEKIGWMEGMASDCGNLGIIYRQQGDLDRAEQMHRKAMEINEKLGRMEGVAIASGNLGVIYQIRGDLDRAEQILRKALEIEEHLGRMAGVASDYGNLGLIYQTRGDLDRAEQMHRKALEINEKLGCLEGVAHDLGNLGVIYQTRGDLDRAEQMFRKALEINDKLGRMEGVANQSGNLGSMAADRGDLDAARELWTRALTIFREIGAAHRVEQTQRLLDGLPERT